MSVISALVALSIAAGLLLKALEWWHAGTFYRQLSRPALVGPRLDDLCWRIEDARADLVELQTPGWYDRAWPICDDLDVSSNGEYCRRCFRQVSEHQVRLA